MSEQDAYKPHRQCGQLSRQGPAAFYLINKMHEGVPRAQSKCSQMKSSPLSARRCRVPMFSCLLICPYSHNVIFFYIHTLLDESISPLSPKHVQRAILISSHIILIRASYLPFCMQVVTSKLGGTGFFRVVDDCEHSVPIALLVHRIRPRQEPAALYATSSCVAPRHPGISCNSTHIMFAKL